MISVLFSFISCSSGTGNVLIVASASSLSNAMKELTQDYGKKYSRNIKLYTAASGIIAAQIREGASVDVFIPADIEYLYGLKQSGMVLKSVILCKNSLVFAVKTKTSGSIISSITDPKIKKIGIGNPAYVPAGKYTVKLLKQIKKYSLIKSKFVYGANVSQVLRWLESGNVDASFMYKTDAAQYGNIHILKKWESISGTSILYPAIVLNTTKFRVKSLAFLNFLASDEAKKILEKYGFGI